MKTLSSSELNNISGGNPLFWGVAGAYAYDAMGGYDGINNYLNNSWSSMKAS